jgi:hypothetical protein
MIFAGQVIAGGWVSLTVTVKEQVEPVEDEQLTFVVPFGKNEPETGEQVTVPQPVPLGAGYITTAPH